MKIFVINLEARPDRLAFMSEQLQSLRWERFPAIDGSYKHYKILKILDSSHMTNGGILFLIDV